MKKGFFYTAAILGLFIVLAAFTPIHPEVSFKDVPVWLMLLAGCICLPGLIVTKSRWTASLMLLMVGIGVSIVIYLMAIIHGGY